MHLNTPSGATAPVVDATRGHFLPLIIPHWGCITSEACLGNSTAREFYYALGGRGRTGATLAYSLTDPSGTIVATASTGAATITDNGDGWYTTLVAGSALGNPGAYLESWTGTYTDVVAYTINESHQFLALVQPDPQKTRRDLRWDAALELDDLLTGTMSSDSGTTLVDNTLQNVYNDDYWKGGELYIYAAATGRYQSRRITGSTGSSGTFTVPTWTNTPATGVLYEAHRPGKPTTAEYNRALNRAIEDAIQQGAKLTATFTLTAFNDTVGSVWRAYQPYEYPLPVGLILVGDAWVQDTNDSLLRWRLLHWDAQDTYWQPDLALVAGRRLVRYPQAYNGYQLRLEGQFVPTLLDRDDWFCDVDPSWIVTRALMYLDAKAIRAQALDRDAAAQRTGVWAQATQNSYPVYTPPLNNAKMVV